MAEAVSNYESRKRCSTKIFNTENIIPSDFVQTDTDHFDNHLPSIIEMSDSITPHVNHNNAVNNRKNISSSFSVSEKCKLRCRINVSMRVTYGELFHDIMYESVFWRDDIKWYDATVKLTKEQDGS